MTDPRWEIAASFFFPRTSFHHVTLLYTPIHSRRLNIERLAVRSSLRMAVREILQVTVKGKLEE